MLSSGKPSIFPHLAWWRRTSLFISLFFLCVTVANAHPGYYGTAFHAHSVAGALDLASQESKLIVVYVNHDQRGWKVLRWPNARSQAFIDLLLRETIIVELTGDEASHYLVDNSPAILILNHDGQRLASFAPDAHFQIIKKAVEAEVSQDAYLAALTNLVNNNPGKFFNRERLASALMLSGQYDRALDEYRHCLVEGFNENSRVAIMRRPNVIRALGELSSSHPASERIRSLLRDQRNQAQATLMNDQENSLLARDIGAINLYLNETQASGELVNQLPSSAFARRALFASASRSLQDSGEYASILSLANPQSVIANEIELYQRMRITRPASAEQSDGRGSRKHVIDKSLLFIEALASENHDEQCQLLITQLLAFDNSSKVRSQILQALEKVGRSDLPWQGLERVEEIGQ